LLEDAPQTRRDLHGAGLGRDLEQGAVDIQKERDVRGAQPRRTRQAGRRAGHECHLNMRN
jgi:hypothetical protein